MQACCEAELLTMKKGGLSPAPYYFERVAILLRKEKRYQEEIDICERYVEAVEKFYRQQAGEMMADLRKGPRYQAILKRVPKAKILLQKKR